MVNYCALGRKEKIVALTLLLCSLKSIPHARLVPMLALESLFYFPVHSTLSLRGYQPRLQ